VYRGLELDDVPVESAVPDTLRQPAMTAAAARREILARFASLAGAFALVDVRARYDLEDAWIRERLDDWTRAGKLVRGTFGRDSIIERWCSRRLLELARRRELAQARRQIEAVSLDRFAAFMLRWQHLDAAHRLSGADGTIDIARQMYGLARPAEQWERDYLPARVEEFDPDALSRLIALGELVWIGGTTAKPDEIPTLTTVRFARRGTVRAWVSPTATAPLGEQAERVLQMLERDGASFFDELVSSTGLTARTLRDALRELVGAGLVTNDTMDSLRLVLRWRPIVSPATARDRPDALATRRLHSVGEPIRGAASAKPPAAASVEAAGQGRRRAGRVAGSLVARARAARSRSGGRRERMGRTDRQAVARAIRHRVARDVAAGTARRRLAEHLSRAPPARVPRRRATRLFRARALRRAVRIATSDRALARG
jgi:ATP-dependent Lhr-like helicase